MFLQNLMRNPNFSLVMQNETHKTRFGPFWAQLALPGGPEIVFFLKYGRIIYRWNHILILVLDFNFILPNFHFWAHFGPGSPARSSAWALK